ncbi:MAG: acetolactate synthase large subunit, partial [Campylobacterales bacterium]|nr:acetolactate synthase large subunit [Campylobacterales bacterium]
MFILAIASAITKHDLLTLTGGAIGQGLPVALGATVACPNRPVIALVGDGSAMYTIQALWSMAREKSNVTVIIFNNLSYGILNIELQCVGANKIGDIARSQLNIASPNLDFVQLGQSMGVSSTRVETCEDFKNAFIAALAKDGTNLIEAVIPNT